MLTLVELLEELSVNEIALAAPDVNRLKAKFGDRVLQMGHLQPDGSIQIPVDCVIEAVHSIGSARLGDAVSALKSAEMTDLLQSADSLVGEVAAARKRKLQQLVEEFQADPTGSGAGKKWKSIEKLIFGIDFPDALH